jgi:hypothetical protein
MNGNNLKMAYFRERRGKEKGINVIVNKVFKLIINQLINTAKQSSST